MAGTLNCSVPRDCQNVGVAKSPADGGKHRDDQVSLWGGSAGRKEREEVTRLVGLEGDPDGGMLPQSCPSQHAYAVTFVLNADIPHGCHLSLAGGWVLEKSLVELSKVGVLPGGGGAIASGMQRHILSWGQKSLSGHFWGCLHFPAPEVLVRLTEQRQQCSCCEPREEGVWGLGGRR